MLITDNKRKSGYNFEKFCLIHQEKLKLLIVHIIFYSKYYLHDLSYSFIRPEHRTNGLPLYAQDLKHR